VVEKLHYQSRPGLYVTANLYRPADGKEGERRPAVLYVCGHSPRGRDGNKTAFQSHGIWFARHGYVCLVVDTLQLGEIAAIHHGTYREERWWWHSRGYTPAGVECWNGIRGIDYLSSRPDVDPERIAVTGISGGGAVTFWVAAADERVSVAVPVSGMGDLPSYVADRVVDEHCDCMFVHNTFEWPWTRIAALVAPRPLLFVNSDQDALFPMDANERVAARLERLYALFGAGALVDSVVSRGGHAYREDIRRAAYRFVGTHLTGDGRPVRDSEIDLVVGTGTEARHPIPPGSLRAFAVDSDIPADERNTTIDRSFVPMAEVPLPDPGAFEDWKQALLAELRRVTFRDLPWPVAGELEADPVRRGWRQVVTEGPVRAHLAPATAHADGGEALVVVASEGEGAPAGPGPETDEEAWLLYPRGTGPTRWTRRNPPNYVERAHVLLGRTVDSGRVRDVALAARALKAAGRARVRVSGEGAAGVLAAYAALWTPEIDAVSVARPPASHMSEGAPQLLNVLRVCDVPEALGMLAPRPLTLVEAPAKLTARVRAIYETAGAIEHLTVAGPSAPTPEELRGDGPPSHMR
jgi:dienelactone hydrolase